MSTGWLERSGIKGDVDTALTGESAEPAAPEVDVKNDKATPVIADERGIASVNRTGFRSRVLPLSMSALVLAAVGFIWLIPGPKVAPVIAKDDPRASKNERFDENRPTAVLIPSAPPAPPGPSTSAPQSVASPPPLPSALAMPSNPIRIVPAPDPRAMPALVPKAAAVALPTPLELRQQSKVLIVGSDEKAAPTSLAPSALTSLQGGGASRARPPSNAAWTPDSPAEMTGEGASAQIGSPASPNSSPAVRPGTAAERGGAAATDALGAALRPTLVSGTAAARLADRTFMMSQGSLLDCSLDVAISSAVPGMVKCTLTRSVYGDDRKVVLLERGTELTGQYQGGMQQGQKRLFILWVRAKTPSGVVVTLSSPGTDALGRGGVDGFVDVHFWERFGAGLLLSVIDDAFQIASSRAQHGSSTTVVLPQNTSQTTKNAASIALENDVRIPPTLEKNQGDHVSVFVARDLDFRTVYALRPVDGGP